MNGINKSSVADLGEEHDGGLSLDRKEDKTEGKKTSSTTKSKLGHSPFDQQSTVEINFCLMHMSIIGCCKLVSVKNSFKGKCQEKIRTKKKIKKKNSCRRKVEL